MGFSRSGYRVLLTYVMLVSLFQACWTSIEDWFNTRIDVVIWIACVILALETQSSIDIDMYHCLSIAGVLDIY